jgi:hypothetical protein
MAGKVVDVRIHPNPAIFSHAAESVARSTASPLCAPTQDDKTFAILL